MLLLRLVLVLLRLRLLQGEGWDGIALDVHRWRRWLVVLRLVLTLMGRGSEL